MFVTAAYILEKYSGMSFPDFAHQRIFSPLGMNATSMSDELAVASSRLSQSWSLKQRRIPFWFSGKNMKTIAGAGGIISSARDMVSQTQKKFFLLKKHIDIVEMG